MTTNTDKKILLIITKSTFGGGAQRYVYDLALALKDRGFTVAAAAGEGGPLLSELSTLGIKTYHINGAQRDISIASEIRALYSLTSIIREFKPDVVHLNSSKIGVLGSIVGRLLQVPRIIFTAHGWPFWEPRSRLWRLMAWLGSYLTTICSHHTIVVSEFDKVRSLMPFVGKKITVIHTGIPQQSPLPRSEARALLFPDQTISDHEHNIWIGTIGELNHNKNHTTLVDAVAEFNTNHNIRLFLGIIGEGELRSALTEQIELRGQTDHIHLLGRHEKAARLLSAFDIFVFPSYKEGLPYALLEAGLARLPVIASAVGGIPEVVRHDETGLLIKPGNHNNIVEALSYLLTESEARSRLAENLYEHVCQNFTIEDMISKTIDVYQNHQSR